MTRRVDTLFTTQAQPPFNAELIEWDPTIVYPANAKATIPDDADFDDADGLVFCFDMYLNSDEDTNIICKYSELAPEWWIGIYAGKLVGLMWDDALDAYGATNVNPDEFIGKWCRVSVVVGDFTTRYIQVWIAPLGSTAMEALAFNGGGYTIDDASAVAAGNRSISTNDILIGINGRIRNLYFGAWNVTPPDFFTDRYLDRALHHYSMNEGSGLVMVDDIGTLNGTYDAAVEWDNQQEDGSLLPAGEWVDHLHFGTYGQVAYLDRTPQQTAITSCIAQRKPTDARNVENYLIPGAPPLLSVDVEAGTGHAVLTFAEELKALKKYNLSLARAIETTAPPTLGPGYIASFSIDETDLPDYAIDKSSMVAGALRVVFNFNIKPSIRVSGIDVAWIDYESDSVTIWTNDSGSRTIVISGVTDTSGNVLDDQTISVKLPSMTRTIQFEGRTIVEKFVVKDDLESQVSRNNRNYAEAEIERNS